MSLAATACAYNLVQSTVKLRFTKGGNRSLQSPFLRSLAKHSLIQRTPAWIYPLACSACIFLGRAATALWGNVLPKGGFPPGNDSRQKRGTGHPAAPPQSSLLPTSGSGGASGPTAGEHTQCLLLELTALHLTTMVIPWKVTRNKGTFLLRHSGQSQSSLLQ